MHAPLRRLCGGMNVTISFVAFLEDEYTWEWVAESAGCAIVAGQHTFRYPGRGISSERAEHGLFGAGRPICRARSHPLDRSQPRFRPSTFCHFRLFYHLQHTYVHSVPLPTRAACNDADRLAYSYATEPACLFCFSSGGARICPADAAFSCL